MTHFRARLPEITLVTAIVVLFHRLLLGEVLFWGTPSLQFVPWQEMAFDELRQGRLPLWNPLLGNGTPLLANYQTSFFYPPNWLHLILPSTHLMGWLGMLHLLWAGLGMMAYLRRLGLDRFGQGMGALVYALSGYLVSRLGFLSITSAAAWLPWLLWSIDGLWPAEDIVLRRRVALLGAIVAMQLLAGHAQTTFYSLALAALYAVWRGLRLGKPVKLLAVLVGVLLGASMAAIQLLPTLELLRTSQRSAGVDFERALSYSFWPWRPLTWIAPNIFGSPATDNYWAFGVYWEDATYIGLLGVIAAGRAVLGWLRAPRLANTIPGRAVVPFFVALIPPVLLLALGQNTPAFIWLYRHVPSFNLFQAPARWMLLAVFAMATLAGIGVQQWQLTDRGVFWTRLTTAGGVSILIVGLAALQVVGVIEPTFLRATIRAGISIIIIGAFILTQPPPDAARRWLWQAGILALLAVDLVSASWGLNPTINPTFYRQPRASLASKLANRTGDGRTLYLPQDEEAAKFETFLDLTAFGPTSLEAWAPLRQSLLPNLGMLDDVPSANNFDPLRIGAYDAYFKSIEDVPIAQALPRIRAMNVNTLLTTGAVIEGLQPVAKAGPVSAYAVPDALPRAYMVYEAWGATSAQDALDKTARAGFDPAQVVVLQSGADAAPRISSEQGTVTVMEARPQTVLLHVQTDVEGWLVLADSWYPGWQATLDGDAVTILRANGAFRAVVVPAGQHVVEFKYKPASLLWGAALSLITLGIVIVLTQWRAK